MHKALAASCAGGLLLFAGCGVTLALAAGGHRPIPHLGVSTNLASTVPAAFAPWVTKAGQICPAIKPPIIAGHIATESGWDINAHNPTSGADGPGQFMAATWAAVGRDDDGNGRTSRRDIGDAVMATGRYLCQLHDEVVAWKKAGKIVGDPLKLTIATYNAGAGNILKYHGVPPFAETLAYVPKVLTAARNYSTHDGQGASSIVAAAKTQLGVPYVFGAGDITGPTSSLWEPGRGFDCSGFTQYAVFQASGGALALPHLAEAQATYGHPVPPTLAAMKPGDLVFFALGRKGPRIDHVGIYMGGGQMINAGRNNPSAAGAVRINDLTSPYWAAQQWTVRRLNLGGHS